MNSLSKNCNRLTTLFEVVIMKQHYFFAEISLSLPSNHHKRFLHPIWCKITNVSWDSNKCTPNFSLIGPNKVVDLVFLWWVNFDQTKKTSKFCTSKFNNSLSLIWYRCYNCEHSQDLNSKYQSTDHCTVSLSELRFWFKMMLHSRMRRQKNLWKFLVWEHQSSKCKKSIDHKNFRFESMLL